MKSRLLLLACALIAACQSTHQDKYFNWQVYRGSKEALQYSALDQINTQNVSQLQVAWTYQSGGNTKRSTIQCNPIIIGESMFITSPDLRVIALNAATGEEIWQFDPAEQNIMGGVNRGVTYWEQEGDQRILFTARHLLFALDAKTGEPISSFGENGKVDMRQNLGIDPETVTMSSTSPGIIYNDLIILGSSVGEGYQSAPGHIRAYNVKDGQLAWIFHTIPQEGEFAYETWEHRKGESFGGANAWGGLSLDEERGWVFASTGSIAFDFYGGGRKGKNLFSDCVLALNASTGERIWHYQVVRHDLWDYDLPCAPNLINLQIDGETKGVVVQPTKMGYLFILDRETGEPLHPVEEIEVASSTIPGEETWPTQPIPTFPDHFAKSGFTEADLSDISAETHAYVKAEFDKMKAGSPFIPPSFQGSLSMPGTRGGAEWSGASLDPESNILYINANEIANILKINAIPVVPPSAALKPRRSELVMQGFSMYQLNCAGCHGMKREGAMPSYPPLNKLSSQYSTSEIRQIISQGQGAMPSFKQFSNRDLQALSTFLLASESEIKELDAGNESYLRYVIDGYRQFLDQEGYPANKPPWGSLNAIDLSSGKLLWKVPLGEYPELTERGIPITGTQNLGGCVATAGGLVFVGAAKDEKFRAFDKKTGRTLWEYQLPAGGYATPAIYELAGKQYIVIAAGGGGKNGTKSGDTYVVFSLP